MGKLLFKHSESAYGKFRVFICDSVGAGLTGLTFSTTGLSIHTIADNEASVTSYTAAGSTIETITTIGTFAAPTATKCRFKEIDSTNLPGWYEVQIADARWAVASSRAVQVQVTVTGGFCAPVEIQLALFDVNDSTPDVNVAQISNDSTAADNAEAFFDGTGYAGTNNVIPTVTTVNGLGAGVITAASIATGAIDADAIAADAAAEIADAVWDEATSGHATAGTTGEALTDAAAGGGGATAADVWSYGSRTLTTTPTGVQIDPVRNAGLVEILGGYDYTTVTGGEMDFPYTDAPDLTGATASMVLCNPSETSIGFTATILNAGTATQTVRVQATGAQTAALKLGNVRTEYRFRIKVTLATSEQVPLSEGILGVS